MPRSCKGLPFERRWRARSRLTARAMPLFGQPNSPKTPLTRLHNPHPQKQIGDSVRQYASRETFRPVSHPVIEHARKHRRRPVGPGVGKAKCESHDCERYPGKFPERNLFKLFIDKEAKQESTPKDFLKERHDQDKPKKAKENCNPIKQCLIGKNGWVKTIAARR